MKQNQLEQMWGGAPNVFTNRQLRTTPVFLRHKPGKMAARVKDVLIDKERGQVLGFVLECDGIWQGNKFLPLVNVAAITKDKVLVNQSKPLHKVGLKRQRFAAEPWFGMPIYNESGKDFGTMADFVWSFPSGKVLSVAVSGGLWSDLNKGLQYLPWQDVASRQIIRNQIFVQGEAHLQDNFGPPKIY